MKLNPDFDRRAAEAPRSDLKSRRRRKRGRLCLSLSSPCFCSRQRSACAVQLSVQEHPGRISAKTQSHAARLPYLRSHLLRVSQRHTHKVEKSVVVSVTCEPGNDVQSCCPWRAETDSTDRDPSKFHSAPPCLDWRRYWGVKTSKGSHAKSTLARPPPPGVL